MTLDASGAFPPRTAGGLSGGGSDASRRVGAAYRLYALAYAPLALLNMLTVWRAALGPLVRFYREALEGHPGPVLDVAIGDGSLTAIVRRRLVVDPVLIGLDISEEMLTRAVRRLGRARFWPVRGDARCLPFPPASFDRVCCFGGLHVIPFPDQALASMAGVLRPQGRFFASVLLRPRGWWPRRLAERYVELGLLSTLFEPAALRTVLQQAGLPPVREIRNGRMLLLECQKPAA